MRNLLKFLIASIFITSFSNVSANLAFEKPMENDTINSIKYEATGTCDKNIMIDVQDENVNSVYKNTDVKCENGKFKTELDFSGAKNGNLKIAITQDAGQTIKEINIKLDLGSSSKIQGSAPNKEALTLKIDPRVKLQGEEFEIEKTKENPENKENNKDENNKNEKDKKEEIIEVILENGNKFSHKRLSCKIPQNVKENLTKELKTNFTDISNSKFINEIKNLEDVKVIVGTSKNTFENREITKIELLGLVLKANCYDISTNGDWREKVLSVGLENKIIDVETFKNNKNISKKDAFKIILKGGKIITPKVDSTDSMRYLGVFSENEKIEENMNLNRDEAVNILVNILKKYK